MTLGERPEVIFVGGTRFSCADAVARLLAGHREVRGLPIPVRFHSDPWGIPALLHGRIALDDFAERLRTLAVAERVAPQRLESALAALRTGYAADPLRSCRELFWTLIHDLMGELGSGTLVESSLSNLVEAHTLTRLVPPARFVHVVRDGRCVAAAVADSEEVGTRRIPAGLEWWAGELREIERGMRGEEDGAPYAIPDDHLAVVVLDELVSDRTGAAYRRLLERLSLGEDEQVADFSPSGLDAAAIGDGGWRTHARGPTRWWVTRRYERTLDELEAEGNHAAPALRAAFERSP